MAKFVFSFGLVALVVVLIATEQRQVLAAPFPTKDLILHVHRFGDGFEQVVDNQQGQVVKQIVVPGGIRQTVYRNGQIITDDVVRQPTVTVI